MSATLRLDNGRKLEPTLRIEGDCSDDLSIELAPDDEVTLCVPFDVPDATDPTAFVVTAIGIVEEPQIAKWTYES
jgi:hypothetical protein